MYWQLGQQYCIRSKSDHSINRSQRNSHSLGANGHSLASLPNASLISNFVHKIGLYAINIQQRIHRFFTLAYGMPRVMTRVLISSFLLASCLAARRRNWRLKMSTEQVKVVRRNRKGCKAAEFNAWEPRSFENVRRTPLYPRSSFFLFFLLL